jgi:hypothetical protein
VVVFQAELLLVVEDQVADEDNFCFNYRFQ